MHNHDLYKDGFCFLHTIFSKNQAHSARDGLWEVINGHYETGRSPESRFWSIGDDPASIIKIDKPPPPSAGTTCPPSFDNLGEDTGLKPGLENAP